MGQYASQLIGRVAVEGAEKAKADFISVGEHAQRTESAFKKLREQVMRGFEFGTGMQLAQVPGNIMGFLKDQFVDIVKAGIDEQAVLSDTTNTLQHMGRASGQTAESIGAFAEKMSTLTIYSKDLIQHGENVMLTFGHIGKEIFPQATMAAMNLSQKLGQDLQSSVTMIGKALDNPIQGFGALQRVGVSFDATERAQIKTMQEHGNILGAQKIIMFELNRQYGGLAETIGKTFGGSLQIAQNRVEQIKEKIGTALLPILNEFLQYFELHLLPRLDDFSNWFQAQGIPKLQQFGDWFEHDGIPLLETFGSDIGTVINWVERGGPAVDLLRDAFIGVGAAIIGVKIVNFGKDVASTIHEGISDVKSFINTVGTIKDKLGEVADFFANNFQTKAKASLSGIGATADATGNSISGIGSAAEGNVAKMQGAAVKEEIALGETTVTADATGSAVAGIGTKAEIAAGTRGVGGLMGAVSSLFNLVGPAIGIGLLAEQLNIAIGMIEAGPQNSATITGKAKHYHGPHSFATGVTNFEGGLAYVHKNELLVNMPQGTNVIPSSQTSSLSSGKPVIINLHMNGRQTASALIPDLVELIRNGTGTYGL